MLTESLTHSSQSQCYLAQWELFLCTVNSTLFTVRALTFAQDLQYIQSAGKCLQLLHTKTIAKFIDFHNGSAMKCRATKSFSSFFSLFLIRSVGFWQGFWGVSSVLEASLWSCLISSVRDKCSWKLLWRKTPEGKRHYFRVNRSVSLANGRVSFLVWADCCVCMQIDIK